MNKELVVFKDVSMCFYDSGFEIRALDNISFCLYEGEILGVIGESGSGKSTIAKILTGLYQASKGEVLFRDKNITKQTKKEQRELYTEVQMVFQDAVGSFNPRRTIGQSIGETIHHLCQHDKQCISDYVEALLIEVGLKAEYADKYPHELSGGECQRAAIARALAVHPKVLICDEATSALDVSAQARIVDLLVKLRQKHNISMIFITHDLPLVSSLTDRVIIMNNGRIVEEGNSQSVIANPSSDFTKKLLEAVL